MGHRGFDEQMEALDALKGQKLDPAAIALVKKSLANRSNFLVAKAARLAEENQLEDLVPDLLAAYDHFFVNAEKSDPQCWAKNAISRALPRLGCREKQVYLRGLSHFQWEPTWGGKSDSAGTLRANCAHALVACEGVTNQDVLLLLVDRLVDPDKSVRVETVRAVAQIGELAAPVLRLRAQVRPTGEQEDPEVLGACFAALLSIEGEPAIEFVARFLEAGDDAAGEAAFVLAETHSPVALAALLARQRSGAEPWFAGVLLSAIALTRLPTATDFLLGMIEREEREAPAAIEALARLAPGAELRERLETAVQETGSSRLLKALREHLPVQNETA